MIIKCMTITFYTSIVQLKGTSKDSNFRGFLIQARTVGDGSAVGSFDRGTLHKQVCTNEVCLNCVIKYVATS